MDGKFKVGDVVLCYGQIGIVIDPYSDFGDIIIVSHWHNFDDRPIFSLMGVIGDDINIQKYGYDFNCDKHEFLKSPPIIESNTLDLLSKGKILHSSKPDKNMRNTS